ncbi:MAG: uroporphyrinogen-III synthase [Rhodanobacteraceae bacterium]
MPNPPPLGGTRVAITRPAGTGAPLARAVQKLGGTPILLPGSSLRAAVDPGSARKALEVALDCDVVIFTSPAAVRFAKKLARLRSRGEVLAPGTGTRNALRRAGLVAQAPSREDSEGILGMPILRNVRGRRIGIVGAAGGRGLLVRELRLRGADVVHAHVYRRLPARLDRHHAEALLRDPRRPLYALVSSAEALANIIAALPAHARGALLAGTAVVSSARLADAARDAGFARVLRAASPHAADLLAAVVADRQTVG